MIDNKVRNIVNHTRNSNQLRTLRTPLLEVIPVHDRKLRQWNPPVELRSLPIQRFLLLLQPPLLNLILTESLEIIRHRAHPRNPELAKQEDKPLCRIVLIPNNRIAIIAGKLMMEIMIPLAHRNQRSKHMIPRTPTIVKRLLANPMRKTVHAERSLLDEARAQKPRVHQPAPPVAPA